MRRGLAAALGVALVCGWMAVRIGLGVAESIVDTPYRGYDGVVDVVVPRGASAGQVAERLEAEGVVRDARWLRWWLRWNDQAGALQAGQYRFRQPRSLREVADILVQGRVRLQAITFREGATRWEIAEAIAAAGFATSNAALAATERVELIEEIDPHAWSLEGYLFPDTYFVPASATAADIVEMMVGRFLEAWTARRRALARHRGMTARQVVTLASLVEAETARSWERPLVAAVYDNRLQRGMLLQCDPTLLYALWLDGRRDRNIRRADFDHESPYNTYKHPGLPPGPIANPGEASLEAALSPAAVDYLFFVGRNDGSHAFSRTLREHNALVNRYQRRAR